VQQIAVRGVTLNNVKAGLTRPPRGIGKIRNHFPDARGVERDRPRIFLIERNCAGCEDFPPSALFYRNSAIPIPRPPRARLPSRMRQLYPGERSLGTNEIRDLAEFWNMRIEPDAVILR